MTVLSFLAFLAAALSPTPAVQQQPPAQKPLVVCTSVGRPALDLIVKNERGQILRRTSWLDEWDKTWLNWTADGNLYTVSINRRWYEPQTVRNIKVLYDDCGPAKPTRVVVRLKPTPNAPAIREFRIVNVNSDNFMAVAYWPYYQRYQTFLDAPGNISREVIWTSSRPDVATIDSSGMMRSVCNRKFDRTTITATLKADPKFTSGTVFGRGGGGMNCKRGAVDR